MSTTVLETQTALDQALQASTAPRHKSSVEVTDYNNRQTVGKITVDNPKMVCRMSMSITAPNRRIKNVGLDIGANEVIAFIGPSGCGKSTFLRCLNRMNDTIPIAGSPGKSCWTMKISTIRALTWCNCGRGSAWCSKSPIPFPKSIYENVAYGPRIHGMVNTKAELDELVRASLERAGLLKEVEKRMQ
jgi:phosphate transport system ATP-binding protein